MASEVQICNLALAHLGTDARLQSLGESSQEGRLAKLFYAQTRDALLRSHLWRFAVRYQLLADLGDPPSAWAYRYQYPGDCLRIVEIVAPTRVPVPYEVAVGLSLDSRVILCDQVQAELKYLARITNPTVFDAAFVTALGWLLAAELALPLTGDEGKHKLCYDAAGRAISAAQAQDANEGSAALNTVAPWIEARA